MQKRNSNPFFKVKRKRKTKRKIQICFSMSCENEKCKWHLNSIFPCHRKTVGTKVHAFVGFTYLKLHQEAKETKYEIRSISEYYVTITRPAVWKRNTPHAVSNTNKGKKVKFIVQISFAEKNWSGSDRALPKHPFFNGRLSWCSIGAAMQLNKGKKNLCRNGLKFSIAWGELKISRWPLHSFKIFEAYLINSLRFSTV